MDRQTYMQLYEHVASLRRVPESTWNNRFREALITEGLELRSYTERREPEWTLRAPRAYANHPNSWHEDTWIGIRRTPTPQPGEDDWLMAAAIGVVLVVGGALWWLDGLAW